MKKGFIWVAVLMLFSGLFAQSATWGFDKAHSSVRFTVSHMLISEVEGIFTNFDGSVTAEKENFSDAKAKFTIQVKSVDTASEKRDQHLKSPDFFDAAQYPTITFDGKKVKKTKNNHYKLTGNLTMHGVTKSVTLDVKYNGTILDPFGNTKAGFKVTGILDRTDWGLTYNSVMDSGGLMIGNEIEITCNIELIKL